MLLRSKFPVELAAAKMSLYPAVREADAETLILADGFSCREQIEQGTGRSALLVADLLAGSLPCRAERRPGQGGNALRPVGVTMLPPARGSPEHA